MKKSTTSNNTDVTIVSAKNVHPRVFRALNVMRLDTANIVKVIGMSELAVPSEQRALYQEIWKIYQQQLNELEEIGKGLRPLPENDAISALNVPYNPPVDYITNGHVYSWVYNLRKVKAILKYALEMPAVPHGTKTDVLGMLAFRVQDVTPREMALLKERHGDIILDYSLEERKETVSKAASAAKMRVMPVHKVKSDIIAGTYSSLPTVRQATPEEMALLAASKAQHEENGLGDL